MSDLNTEIKLSANADGVETGVTRAKRSLESLRDAAADAGEKGGKGLDKITSGTDRVQAGAATTKRSLDDLAKTATQAGEQGGKGMAKFAAGGDEAAKKVDAATRSMQNSLQRQIAALEAGGTSTRQYQESLAKLRGIDTNALKPMLDQLDAAKAKADKASHSIGGLGDATGILRGQLAALAGSLTLGSMAAFVIQVNNGVDALNDIKDATGSTIENISALEDVGKRTGASLDTVGSVLIKFNDVLSKATPQSDIAMELQAIGLNAEELKRIDPAEALLKTAKALDIYADNGTKARLVQDLFGKSVKEAAPFLKDLAEQGGLVAKVTTQQTDEAEKFNKQLFELRANFDQFSRSKVSPFIESINGIAESFREAKAAGDGFFATAWRVVSNDLRQLRGADRIPAVIEGVAGSVGSGDTALARAQASAGDAKPSIVLGPTAAEIAAAKAAAKAAAEARKRELAEQQKFFADMAGLSGDYYSKLAQAQKERAAGNISEEQYVKYVEELIKKQPFATALTRDDAEAIKARSAAIQEAHAADIKRMQAQEQGAAALVDGNRAMRDEIELIGLSEAAQTRVLQQRGEAIILTKQAELAELQRQSAITGTMSRTEIALEAEIAALKERNALLGVKYDRTEFANAMAAETADAQRMTDQVGQGLANSLMQGGKSAWEYIKGLFRTKLVMEIGGVLTGGMTGLFGSSAMAATGTAANTVGTGLNIANLGTSIATLGGNIANLSSAFSTGFSGFFGGSSMANMATAGSMFGAAGSTASTLGYLAGPVGIAALVGNALGLFRSTKTVGGGLTGTLGAGDINAYDLTRTSGTLFGGPDYNLVSKGVSEQSAALQTAFAAMRDNVASMATTLGLGADAIKSFTVSIGTDVLHPDTGGLGLKLDGLTSEQATAKVQAALSSANEELAKTALSSAHLTGWMQRLAASQTTAVGTLQALVAYPDQLLQLAGTTRDALVQTFAQGLMTGDAATAGQSVANQLVASIETAMVGNASAQVFDIVNRGIVTPMLDAMLTGQNVAEAMSEASMQAVVAKATATAQAMGAILNDPGFAAVMASLRSNVGSALSTAGAAMAYTPQYQATTAAVTPAAAADVSSSAASVGSAVTDLAKTFADAQTALTDTQQSLSIDLMRAMGDEAGARAAERAAYLAGLDTMSDAERARLGSLYDQNTAIRDQITAIEKQKTATAELRSLIDSAYSSVDRYQPTDNARAFKFSTLGARAQEALGGSAADWTADFTAATPDQIKAAVSAFLALPDASTAAKTAVLGFGNSLLDMADTADQSARQIAQSAMATYRAGLTGIISAASANTDAAMSAFERGIAGQRKLAETSKTAAEKLKGEVQGIFDTLQTNVDSLFGSVDSTKAWQATQGQQYISAALAAARATGALPDGKELSRAISAATGGLDAANYRTQAEADYAKLVLANELRDLQDISGSQLTEAERQVQAAEAMLTAIEDASKYVQDQLNEARGIKTDTASMVTLLAAIAAESSTRKNVADSALIGTGQAVYNLATSQGANASGQAFSRSDAFAAAAPLVNTGNTDDALALYSAAFQSGFTLPQIETIYGMSAGTLEAEVDKINAATGLNLPKFADGGWHSGGWAMVGERGPELAYMPPAQIYTAPQTASMLGGGNNERLERLVEGLTAEVQRLQGLIGEGNQHTGQLADQFDRVTAGGNGMAAEFVTPQKVQVVA